MFDKFGREFDPQSIKNRDAICLISQESLDEIIAAGKASELVLITSPQNGNRLYLYDDLLTLFKTQFYCRLEDPFTREDILTQVPTFSGALELEANAAHYNAYILNKNPEFLGILCDYLHAVFNEYDDSAGRDRHLDNIVANSSAEMAEVYNQIAKLTPDQLHEFNSLFITNRRPIFVKKDIAFPAKWDLGKNVYDNSLYYEVKKKGIYVDFPHRNVIIHDLLENPDNACMHSWGIDILFLVHEYLRGTNSSGKILHSDQTEYGSNLENKVILYTEHMLKAGSLDPILGKRVLSIARGSFKSIKIERLSEACYQYLQYLQEQVELHPQDTLLKDKFDRVTKLHQLLNEEYPILSNEEIIAKFETQLETDWGTLLLKPGSLDPILGKRMLSIARGPSKSIKIERLSEACYQYLQYLQEQVKRHPQDTLLKDKSDRVTKLHQMLHEEYPILSNEEIIANFETQLETDWGILSKHRDNWVIRFLNLVVSILSLGTKNYITEKKAPGYYGFWNSRGASFSGRAREILAEDSDNPSLGSLY